MASYMSFVVCIVALALVACTYADSGYGSGPADTKQPAGNYGGGASATGPKPAGGAYSGGSATGPKPAGGAYSGGAPGSDGHGVKQPTSGGSGTYSGAPGSGGHGVRQPAPASGYPAPAPPKQPSGGY